MTRAGKASVQLTYGRRAGRLHQYPAFGGLGSGGRYHSWPRHIGHSGVRSSACIRQGV